MCWVLACPRVARDSTVAGAAAELVAALQLIMKLPVQDCGPTNRYIYFVIRNRSEMLTSIRRWCVDASPLGTRRCLSAALPVPENPISTLVWSVAFSFSPH
jgi:hypothetical protein